ncbi:MAG: clostripain-related cysteine peptidase [Myxococcota bacterium]
MVWLLACTAPDDDVRLKPPRDGDPADDTGTLPTDDTGEPPAAATWTLLVFMNGDNDLEEYVAHDLNELEQVGSQAGLTVLVQADRIDGYDDSDGDWTGTRRYTIAGDDDEATVSSPYEELGELDMGDSAVLADFLAWGWETAPADHVAVVLWNHGDGWSIVADRPPGPAEMISSDDTSGNHLSIAEGELADGLAGLWDARGAGIDVIGFDACNMASWEVAHALSYWGDYMVAAETWVGGEGLQYEQTQEAMLAGAPPAEVADEMARTAVEIGEELTYGAVDLGRMDALAGALDALADAALADPAALPMLLAYRDEARGVDFDYEDWYLDVADLGVVVAAGEHAEMAAAASPIAGLVDDAMVGVYATGPWTWTGGLATFFDLTDAGILYDYSFGSGATWSHQTRWDELLAALAGVEHTDE